MRTKKDYELEQAFSERAKAKNEFVNIANNKKSKKIEILEFYKKYKQADDKLISLYEGIKHENKKQEVVVKYDKVA